MPRSLKTLTTGYTKIVSACGLPTSFAAHSQLAVRADHDNPFQVNVKYAPTNGVDALTIRFPPMVLAETYSAVRNALVQCIEPRALNSFLPVHKNNALADTFVCFGYWSEARLAFVLGHEIGHFANGDFHTPPPEPSAMQRFGSRFGLGGSPEDVRRAYKHKIEMAADRHAMLLSLSHPRSPPTPSSPGSSASSSAASGKSDALFALGGLEHVLKMALMHDSVSLQLRAHGFTQMADASEIGRRATHPPEEQRLEQLLAHLAKEHGIGAKEALETVVKQGVAPGIPNKIEEIAEKLGVGK